MAILGMQGGLAQKKFILITFGIEDSQVEVGPLCLLGSPILKSFTIQCDYITIQIQ